MEHPYRSLPADAFWRRSIAAVPQALVDPVGTAKFKISKNDKIATAGSCFAQHIARHLAQNGFTYLVTETVHPSVWPHLGLKYNYGVFTARYGNIYSPRQFRQLLERAYGLFDPSDSIWLSENGRVIDPYRPLIQPDGFVSKFELMMDRRQHFQAVRKAVETLDVLVFTLGLTECWLNRIDGAVYPICPGVSGGTYSDEMHMFHNLNVGEVVEDMIGAYEFIRSKNANAKLILTVSPVPLVATASGNNVLQATTYSKSVLRVAAEEIATKYAGVAYFPSYEIVTGAYNRGNYFGEDLREVTESGVEHVMRLFLKHYGDNTEVEKSPQPNNTYEHLEVSSAQKIAKIIAVVCEEEALGR